MSYLVVLKKDFICGVDGDKRIVQDPVYPDKKSSISALVHRHLSSCCKEKEKKGIPLQDRILTATHLVRWASLAMAWSGSNGFWSDALEWMASLVSETAHYFLLPKDASILRKMILFPGIGGILVSQLPLMKWILRGLSLYQLGEYSLRKCIEKDQKGREWKERALHLFNFGSSLAFMAENMGWLRLRPAESSLGETVPSYEELAKEHCPFENPRCGYAKEHPSLSSHITLHSIYQDNGDPLVKEVADLTAPSMEAYCKKWDLDCEFIAAKKEVLADQCTLPSSSLTACSAYWQKIWEMRNFLARSPRLDGKKEMGIFIDHDMASTNHQIDPYLLTKALQGSDRGGERSSVVFTQDSSDWLPFYFKKGVDPRYNLNTGFCLLENNERAKEVIEKVWEKRNQVKGDFTLGTNSNQEETLQEQEAMVQVLVDNPQFYGKHVRIIPQRMPGFPGINTSYRAKSCFQNERTRRIIDFKRSDREEGSFEKGDVWVQANTVPYQGRAGERGMLGCRVDFKAPVRNVRADFIRELLYPK